MNYIYTSAYPQSPLQLKGHCQREMSMNYFYTAGEAQKHLGVGVGAFYYLVETGKIKKLVPPGKQRGFYSKHLIEKLAEERTGEIGAAEELDVTFQKATLNDIHEEYEFATLLLNGSLGYVLPTYEAWLQYNPESNFIVRDQGRLVAFMQALPVKRETVQRWLKGEVREWQIGAEDVLPYAPGSSVECIITSIATAPDVDKWKRTLYGLRLIRGFLHVLDDLAARDVTITRFYAASTMLDGLSLLKRAKFEKRGFIGKRAAFELDPLSADTHMAKAYRSALQRHITMKATSERPLPQQ
jgi:hypothetical protein